ncbi:N-acetylglucosamine-6-phosphate deacetylase [Sinobacterium norvegicum]|uniref:N-acetylglucosamine-6-phosphate deacetylase n=1 Tax=Sinobacterium norvegicum TaxID=1641715 RepID=A0ABN8EER1_9GAMM|nr:N-acetylglucosamine-6-phosphate deacetylase [Sinobacterium norvegicum]CAH0990920.1 N-acetylglucosamine-6-phosphate deacetylase [Sinobacterium norvegicum]
MSKAFINGDIFTGEEVLSGYTLYTDGDTITDVSPESPCHSYDGEIIDCAGKTLAPGFIDIQVNGGGGVLFNDQTNADGIEAIVKAHQRFGTVAMLPTLISDSHEKIQAAITATDEAIAEKIPGVLGVHLEGPFLNPERKGVHNPEYFSALENDFVPMLSALKTGATLVTMAPEQSQPEIVKQLSNNGVLVFAGHTGASYQQTKVALNNGLKGFTHLFNAMTPMLSREPGVVGAALEDTHSWCGIIVDGYHVDNASLKVAIAAKATGKMVLVTDAMPTVGAEDKRFVLNGEEIVAKNGRCATAADTLAGSDLDMISAVNNTVKWLDVDWQEAIRMASTYPAQCLGVDHHYGFLAQGYKASFVVLDQQLNLDSVWVEASRID